MKTRLEFKKKIKGKKAQTAIFAIALC